MNKHNNISTLHEPEHTEYEYQIDEKRVFIVTPIYFGDKGKTIYDVLLSLMLKHE